MPKSTQSLLQTGQAVLARRARLELSHHCDAGGARNYQIRRITKLVRRKRSVGQVYQRAFVDMAEFQIAPLSTEHAENVYWVFGMVVTSQARFSRDGLMRALSEQGIGTRT